MLPGIIHQALAGYQQWRRHSQVSIFCAYTSTDLVGDSSAKTVYNSSHLAVFTFQIMIVLIYIFFYIYIIYYCIYSLFFAFALDVPCGRVLPYAVNPWATIGVGHTISEDMLLEATLGTETDHLDSVWFLCFFLGYSDVFQCIPKFQWFCPKHSLDLCIPPATTVSEGCSQEQAVEGGKTIRRACSQKVKDGRGSHTVRLYTAKLAWPVRS